MDSRFKKNMKKKLNLMYKVSHMKMKKKKDVCLITLKMIISRPLDNQQANDIFGSRNKIDAYSMRVLCDTK